MNDIRVFGKKSPYLHSCLVTKCVVSLKSNQFFVHFYDYDTFYSDNKLCAQRFIEFTDEKLKPKIQIEDEKNP